ncbi:MAG: lamin tail domain-containing protein, partial [Paludibacteraceae bacterium]|nr:lamin tail domain-containing protein [Paludibacteraceae bacterium]
MNLHKLIYSILIGALCWSIVAAADNYVIINQVMYDTPENEIPVLGHAYNGEFIELYNAGTSDVALNGWQLHGGGSSEVWTFSTTDNIPAGGYLIVSCRRGSGNTFVLSDLFDDEEILPANSTIIYQNKIILNNDGETITLCNAANDTIDLLHYDGESHQTDPYRLHAENATGISGSQCVSLHRTWVEFDEDGIAITGTGQWQTASVLFGRHMLPYDTYQETSLLGAQSLPDGENYVLSVMPLDPTSRIDIADGRLSVSSGVRMQASLTYMDGIGRQEQTIAMRATPGGKDIVSVAEYNGKRKPAKQWLPVVLQTEGQRTHVSDLKTQAQTDYGDSRPFVETQYESSAQGRPTKRYQAGETYGAAAAENIYDIYDGTMDVRIYTIVNDSFLKTTGANYAPQTLYKTTTRDEDGKSLITYTDKSGRTVMEQRGDNQIYYVYDETGRLRYILPHNAQSKLTNGEYGPDNAVLRAAAYYYQYDARGNMIYKRLPGCEPQYMVYDQTGQLVLKQDGNQRAANKWTLCAYDSIGRNLYVAELPLPEEHSYYIDFFADRWAVEHYGNNHSYPLTGTGYASSILGKTGLHLLTVNYYDDYRHLNLIDTPTKQALSFKPLSGYDPQHDNAIGMLTGTRVYNLSDDNYTITAYYYDAQGRVVQSRSTRNAGGVTATSAKYHFDGTVAQRLVTQGTDSDMVSEHYRYLYDHMGRIQKVYYQLNNDAEIILSAFSYDSIGRLVQNLLHNSVDTVRYSYDMRNMLTETRSRHFSEGLFYADNLPEEYVSACYNGSISAVRTSWADT